MDKFDDNKKHVVVIELKGNPYIRSIWDTRGEVIAFLNGFFFGIYSDMAEDTTEKSLKTTFEFVYWEVLEDLINRWENETEDEFTLDFVKPFDAGIKIKFSQE